MTQSSTDRQSGPPQGAEQDAPRRHRHATKTSALVAGIGAIVLSLSAPAHAADTPPVVGGPATVNRPAKRLNIIDAIVFGRSVQGRELVAYRLGSPGGRVVLVVGNVHGDEPKGVEITSALRRLSVPPGVDLFVVDTMNPDGMAVARRQNAHGVDLNRNFSHDWGYIPMSTTNGQYSGEAPADQPETKAMQSLIEFIAPEITVFYHQDANRVSLAGARKEIPREYARLVGQTTGSTPCTQGCTGTAGSFVNHLLPAGTSFLVELPNSRFVTPEVIDRHVAALLTVMVI